MFRFDKVTNETTVISADDDSAAVKIEFASQPLRTAVSIIAPAESYNGILIRAYTEDGQERELYLSLAVCGTETIR